MSEMNSHEGEGKLGRIGGSIKNNNKFRRTAACRMRWRRFEMLAKRSITRHAIAVTRVCPIRCTVRYAFDSTFDCAIVKNSKNRNKCAVDRVLLLLVSQP